MNSDLNAIIVQLGLSSWKEEMQENRKKLATIKNKMSWMTIHNDIADYAYHLGELDYFKKDLLKATNEQKDFLLEEIQKLEVLIKNMEIQETVLPYKLLRDECQKLEETNNHIYQTLLRKFPNQLKAIDTPTIFVYQGTEEAPIHIIFPDQVCDFSFVHQKKEPRSKRELRHFYNQVHFQYLDSLTETKDFDESFQKVKNLFHK